MIEKLLDFLTDEKLGCKEYKEIAEETDDMEMKEMFEQMAEEEHNHYKMIRDRISQMIEKEQ